MSEVTGLLELVKKTSASRPIGWLSSVTPESFTSRCTEASAS
ncbi:MAG: hypothetical protein QM804_01575 [Propionicimonas sp.]